MNATEERRSKKRLDKVFSVYITGSWGSAFGIARNISDAGMFIETHDPYPLGTRMQVTFSFPNKDTEMSAMGEVVHLCFSGNKELDGCRKLMAGMGIHFVCFFQEETRSAFIEQQALH